MSTDLNDLDQTPPWHSGSTAPMPAERLDPGRVVGHYRLEGVLGEGTYGRVHLARHEVLGRRVAVKVLHRRHDARTQEIRAFLNEALILADLDHPGIVPVFDAGWEEDGIYYIVSKYVEGCDLGQVLRRGRPGFREAAGIVEAVAGAVHHAHSRGLVHRDIKPANILIDATGRAYVTDFGVALRDRDFGRGARLTGTPAYMSPEQARGEAHRVDGRSDVFSVGVVFYQLLTGQRPFRGRSMEALSDQILRSEASLPREVDPAIPEELERICLKAMAKRAGARYTSAEEMASDLRRYLAEVIEPGESVGVMASLRPLADSRKQPSAPTDSQSWATTSHAGPDFRNIKIRPRGLRPFEADDADFFLDLLPGPRGLFGLPECLGFWRSKIEGVSDKTLRVGLIYGPSGSGKTSMVQAGLLPRLSGRVLSVHTQPYGDDAEILLLRGIRDRCPGLPDGLSLAETLVAVRKGDGLPKGGKLLLVLDQLERWLEVGRGKSRRGLMAALRQCDGEHIQALAVVRDDRWVAAGRFMRDLDERIVEGGNTTATEAFDPGHAERVLEAFGRGYGALPDESADLAIDQVSFLKMAVQRLGEGETILPARLALFAQMIRGRPWRPATLEWVGHGDPCVRFLEESFGGGPAPAGRPRQRRPARSVLSALLPTPGVDRMIRPRSRQELLDASGHASRPANFEALMDTLVDRVGLVTPMATVEDEVQYRLTHDHLIEPLREWLTPRTGVRREASPRATNASSAEVKPGDPGRPIDLNFATEEELRTLPGIGPATARRMIEGRPFGDVDDLLRLKGMSRMMLSRIRGLVTID